MSGTGSFNYVPGDYTVMTRGTLCVIACPMLEDELIYSLGKDPESKRVYVLDTPYNGSLRRKMEQKGVEYETADEWDFMNGALDLDRDGFNVVIRMKNLALHAEPKELMQNLENDLVMLQGRVDAVAMYYGMCGNYGMDLTKWAKENLNYPVATFRDGKGRVCDDCVGVAVGGLDGYQRLIKEYTGVMLFTPAVATNWEDFLGASDMAKGLDVLGPGNKKEQMKWMLEMCGYNSVVQIDTGLEDRAEFDAATKDFADCMGLRILQADPDYADKGPADRIYTESKGYLGSNGSA